MIFFDDSWPLIYYSLFRARPRRITHRPVKTRRRKRNSGCRHSQRRRRIKRLLRPLIRFSRLAAFSKSFNSRLTVMGARFFHCRPWGQMRDMFVMHYSLCWPLSQFVSWCILLIFLIQCLVGRIYFAFRMK